MSTKKPNIYQKINRVMARVGVVKYEDKRVNNQYSYLSHDAVVRSVRRQMVIEGIVMRLAKATMSQILIQWDKKKKVFKLSSS